MSRTNFSTYLAIKQELLDMFKKQAFPGNKLPPESELARQMGISLVTLREALLMLAMEGYITKQHGSGNYIHKSTLDFENRSIFYLENLACDGHSASVSVLSQTICAAEADAAAALQIPEQSKVLVNRILYLQDDIPAIFLISQIPVSLLKRSDYENMDFSHLHEMIWKYCEDTFAHSLNEYLPLNPPDEVAEILHLQKDAAILSNNQVFYDSRDIPVMFSRSYYYPSIYKLRILQNWALL
jgi:DNA-binding GntR family transcriptional regulator